MALPLQPALRPAHPFWRRAALAAALIIAILALGAAQDPGGPPDRLLGNDGRQRYLGTVGRLIDEARERIWLVVYVARLQDDPSDSDPVRWLCRRLIAAGRRGVDVRVVLERGDPDAKWPGPDNSPVGDLLQAAGIQVHYDELERRTHSKALLVDERAIVGSHNWTTSALLHNRELSLATSDPAVVDDLAGHFTRLFAIE
ncbi:MAG: phospholipase D-like domain-containing protein [Planctomycetota bacterium]